MGVAKFMRPCTITPRVPGTPDARGAEGWAEGDPIDTVCKARPVRADERTINELVDVTEWKVLFPPDTTVTAYDKVTISDPSAVTLELRGKPREITNSRIYPPVVDHITCVAIEVT